MALLRRSLLLAALGGLCLARQGAAQAERRASISEIEAAYLLNFARYVEWPPRALGDTRAPLVLCVIGSKAVEQALLRLAENRTVNGRRVRLTVAGSSDEPLTCHIAYFGRDEDAGLRRPPEAWAERPVLTVGEGEEFLSRGGMIGFVLEAETVRFAIDQEAALRAGLRISSRVLALAVRR